MENFHTTTVRLTPEANAAFRRKVSESGGTIEACLEQALGEFLEVTEESPGLGYTVKRGERSTGVPLVIRVPNDLFNRATQAGVRLGCATTHVLRFAVELWSEPTYVVPEAETEESTVEVPAVEVQG